MEHLRSSDDTIRQTAELFNISYSGLREHILYYHKELVNGRLEKRKNARSSRKHGELGGNGGRHEPKPESMEKYGKAVRMYQTTAKTMEEICEETGVSLSGFRHHLQTWNRELVTEHRNVDGRAAEGDGTKRYLKSTAAKYASAIARLKEGGISTAGAAREFGLHPEVFREYLHEHEPELAARLGLTYSSLNSFIRRNCPDALDDHNRLLHHGESLADNVTP